MAHRIFAPRFIAGLALSLLVGCGAEVPAGGVKTENDPATTPNRSLRVSRRVEPEELLAAARQAGARLVVLDSREFFFDRPGLIPLLWGPPPPGLDVLRDFDAAPTDRLRILGVNGG